METDASMNIIYNENNSDKISEDDFQPAADFQPGLEKRSSFCYQRSISASSAVSNSSVKSTSSPIYEFSKHALDRTNDLLDTIVGYANGGDETNQKCVLVIKDRKDEDWPSIFSKLKTATKVYQFAFEEIYILCTSTGMSQIFVKATDERIPADIVLIREKPFKKEHKAILLALKVGGIRTVNSIDSINAFFEPLWIMTDLKNSLNRSAPNSTNYSIICTSTDGLTKIKEFPATIISGNNNDTCVRIRSTEQIGNIAALLKKASDYVVVEPQMRTLFEVHIVKIGDYVRVFKITPQAKSMVFVEPIDFSSEFKHWMEHLALLHPDMDIVGIRAHFTTEMTWKIYQVESTWLTLEKLMRAEILEQMAALVIEKLQKCDSPSTRAFRQFSRTRRRKSSLPLAKEQFSSSMT